ncbi:hypothetical protein BDW02DRAFT_652052 [Decorospora gaudefroyi]|uniref:HNH nuclease domain-containing protein n=1 Tax=Decorospora gaudefroyi TaxID=184978 RepID=A0A6A5JVM9_9PLEO|nr:hypothetical protein BDW02DRAFT_652052 [Decorospora gaudefroyi]
MCRKCEQKFCSQKSMEQHRDALFYGAMFSCAVCKRPFARHLVTTTPMVQIRAPAPPPPTIDNCRFSSAILAMTMATMFSSSYMPLIPTTCWLSLLRDGSAPIDAASTLRGRSYYFHLDSADDDPYAIVPNFRQWSYPHDRLPTHWQQMAPNLNTASSGITFAPSNLTTALLMRDGSCRLSGCREQLQVAHVVPQAELDWWRANEMSRYNTGSTSTLDDTANAVLLRADLHIAFDKPRIAFVPKPAGDGGDMRLVAHLLEYSPELEHLYHNRELHPTAVGVDMLYARFAWSVFSLLDAFLECKTDRRLALRTSDACLADARGFVTAANCELFSAAAERKRSQSPKKRKPERDTVLEHDEPQHSIASTDATPMKRARRYLISPTLRMPIQSPADSLLSPLDSRSSSHPPTLPLAQAWLNAERQRSDPYCTWDKERDWARRVWDGKTLASDDVGRWFEACGFEVRDV